MIFALKSIFQHSHIWDGFESFVFPAVAKSKHMISFSIVFGFSHIKKKYIFNSMSPFFPLDLVPAILRSLLYQICFHLISHGLFTLLKYHPSSMCHTYSHPVSILVLFSIISSHLQEQNTVNPNRFRNREFYKRKLHIQFIMRAAYKLLRTHTMSIFDR